MTEKHEAQIYSLRDIRLMIGLTQEELARMTGVAAMYISLIENNKRTLTQQTAEKIALALSRLLSSKNNEVSLSPEELRASHLASFYPENIQPYVGNLLYLTTQAAEGLEAFYNQRELPVAEEELKTRMEIVTQLISLLPQKSEIKKTGLSALERIVKDNRDQIEQNKEHLLRTMFAEDGSKGKGFQVQLEKSLRKPREQE